MQPSFARSLTIGDWGIIVAYLAFSVCIGVYFSRRGTRSMAEYFASGRGASWWLLGTSMVATTFAADTPLAISGLVVKQGIWGNWFWWAQVPMFIIGVFFFSRLWRRAGILTDTELVALRYSGQPARILRGFRALYFALPYNCLVMGWVNLSMTKIMALTFNLPKDVAVPVCIFITMAYSAISGLWGVLVTDFFQFFLAMGMAIFLAIYTAGQAGGIGFVISKMQAHYGAQKAATMLSAVPAASDTQNFHIFLIYVLLLWWTVGNTDGGAYLAQRMISAKNEKHAFLAYLWFSIAHFCVRPWPWIVVGMVAAVQFPGIINPQTNAPDPEVGYIAVMLTYLKPGLLGLMLASFLAAFMSTIATQINWGASYLINDFYKPFIKPKASEKHYVVASVVATILMAVLGGAVSFFMNDIFKAWLLLSAINAGIGIVYICRWYWWRVNAWSEMSAIISILATIALILFTHNATVLRIGLVGMVLLSAGALIGSLLIRPQWRKEHGGSSGMTLVLAAIALTIVLSYTLPAKEFPWTLLYTVPISLVVWLTVTLLTAPTSEENLKEFYRRVHPGGPGWKKIAALLPDSFHHDTLYKRSNVIGALFGIIAVFTTLMGIGKLILGQTLLGLGLMVVTVICVWVIYSNLSTEKWEEVG
ncbi:MAG: Na+:solute symporter [candidate division KSB1 bacterium]|nr:Na+:solute symporter [candidate division KSB1 bacterium]